MLFSSCPAVSSGQLLPAVCLVGGSLYRHSNGACYGRSASVIGLFMGLILMFHFHASYMKCISSLLSCGATGFFLADRHWVDAVLDAAGRLRCLLCTRGTSGCEHSSVAHPRRDISARVDPRPRCTNLSLDETLHSCEDSKIGTADDQSWYVVLPLVSSSKSPVRSERSPGRSDTSQ